MKRNLYCGFITQKPSTLKWGYDEEHEDFLKLKLELKHQIFTLIESGVKNFITSLTQGIETVAAELVLQLKEEYDNEVRLVCAIPFEEQASKWSIHQRERYYNILEKSDKNIILQEHFTSDCYINAFDWVSHYSQYMIAIMDNVQRNSAGIMYCKALKQRKFIISIHPYTLNVEETQFSRDMILACN